MPIELDLANLIADRDRLKKALKDLIAFIDNADEIELVRAHRYQAYIDAQNVLILSPE